MDPKFEYLLRLGDNCLVLSQQLGAWCGHGPALEEDLALTNVALDLLGQARLWLAYAGEVEGAGRDEDALAFGRDVLAFRNLLLVEQPNGHYGDTVMRQFLFDAWHQQLLAGLAQSRDSRIAGIAQKAAKEVRYHVERSASLVVALGDGTPFSHHRMQAALEQLWPYTNEWFEPDAVDVFCADAGVAPAAPGLAGPWRASIGAVLSKATLLAPDYTGHQRGGRSGVHTEHLGHLLSELQFVQRAYPRSALVNARVVVPAAQLATPASRETVFGWLGEVMDPEVPVVSVVDLGIVRDAHWQQRGIDGTSPCLVITVTPTYSGCPATEVIAQSIRDALYRHGITQLEVQTRLSPAWTTDWMTAAGRGALRRYGIAPPVEQAAAADGVQVIDIGALQRSRVPVPCPLCASPRTRLLSQFGSTACKALYQCQACLEPFDYFKPH